MALYRCLILMVLVGVFTMPGCSPQEEFQDKGEKTASAESYKQEAGETGEKSASAPTKAVELQTSSWGEVHNGLQCRVTVPKEIEQGIPLEARIELTCDLGSMPLGIGQLNKYLYEDYLTLIFKNATTEQTFYIKPHDPTSGMPPNPDTGKSAIPLDERQLELGKASFPLADLWDVLVPGTYSCKVQFSYSETPKCWLGSKEEWETAGFWYGKVVSGSFMLKILKETPKTKTFMLPKRLRLMKELRVKYGKEDAEKVELPVRNGFFTGCRIYRDDRLISLGGPTVPSQTIQYWSWYKDGDIHTTYTIEIFETSNQPVHDWNPGPGSGGYKVLWKKSFDIHYTEKEIKALK